jgi:hypothetical protein
MDSQKLTKLIKILVEKEIKKQIGPIIKEQVNASLNEALANKFVGLLSEGKQNSLDSLFKVEAKQEKKVLKESELKQREQRLNEIKKKVAGDDPLMQMIYSDVSPVAASAASAMPTASNGGGTFEDPNDEGVDLSKFGF